MKRNKGFTLMELLVTIAIIGVLSSVVAVNYRKAQQSSRDSKRVSDIENIAGGLELYYLDDYSYPIGKYSSNYSWDDLKEVLVSDYLPSLPNDPLYKNDTEAVSEGEMPENMAGYYYQAGDKGRYYIICTYLASSKDANTFDGDYPAYCVNSTGCEDPSFVSGNASCSIED